MKKIISMMAIIIALVLAPAVYAAEESVNPGIMPDSPFYFLDSWGEWFEMIFAFSAEAKSEKALTHAKEKLAEMEAMAEKGNIEAMEKAMARYEEKLAMATEKAEAAKKNGEDKAEEALIRVQEATMKHQTVLQGVLEQVPEEAQESIQKAMQASSRGSEEATKAINRVREETEETEELGVTNENQGRVPSAKPIQSR